jgi:lipopolysaccharide export system permease protein
MTLIGPTLGRYFSARFTKAILGIFCVFFALIYVVDFVELVRRTGDQQGISTGLLAKLALFRTPSVAEQVLPFAVLAGSMVALLNLSRKLELVVARAAGISVWQFLSPGLLVALLVGAVSVGGYNPVSAALKDRALQIEAKDLGRNRGEGKEIWVRQRSLDGQAIIRADRASPDGATLDRVTVFEFATDGAFQGRIEAREAKLEDGYWDLAGARLVQPGIEPQSYDNYVVATNLNRDQVRQSFAAPDTIPFWELPGLVDQTEKAGLDASRYRLQFQSLLARPLLFVAMVFVAASVSLRFFRFGGVSRMVLGGVAAGFALYVATRLLGDLGEAGVLSAPVAAWTPAVVGSLLGTLALLYQEDG